MGKIAIFGDDLESLYCFRISNNVVKEYWSVLLHPVERLATPSCERSRRFNTREARSWEEHFHAGLRHHFVLRLKILRSPSCLSIDAEGRVGYGHSGFIRYMYCMRHETRRTRNSTARRATRRVLDHLGGGYIRIKHESEIGPGCTPQSANAPMASKNDRHPAIHNHI